MPINNFTPINTYHNFAYCYLEQRQPKFGVAVEEPRTDGLLFKILLFSAVIFRSTCTL